MKEQDNATRALALAEQLGHERPVGDACAVLVLALAALAVNHKQPGRSIPELKACMREQVEKAVDVFHRVSEGLQPGR